MQDKLCSTCGISLNCGSEADTCWCMDYIPLEAIAEGKDCMCEACLKNTLEKTETASCKQQGQEDYYIENGFYVFTENYHLKRGSCCKNGCRHCPYGFKK
jgi:hypothetical protein